MKDYKIATWEGSYLGPEVCIDTETDVVPFHSRNRNIATCQVYSGGDTVYFVEKRHLRKFLNTHKTSKLIFQNAPFDVGVISRYTGMHIWYHFYDNDLIYDTKILYSLYSLAVLGEVDRFTSLKHICMKMLGRDIEKNNNVRCTFDQYVGKPISEISEEHLRYAAEDTIHTFDCYKALLRRIKPHDKMGTLLTMHTQVKGHLALDNIYKNGVGVDQYRRSQVMEEMDAEMDTLKQRLAMWGYVQGQKGVNDRYEQIITRLGIAHKLPKSPKSGLISKKEEDLKKYHNLPFISDFLQFQYLSKASSFIRDLKEDVVHGRFNPLLNTGRVSMSSPNLQQLPRVGGIRECFIPKKKENVFIDVDYSAIELVALSEVLLKLYGHSEMANLINSGEDLHYATATSIFKKPMSQITKEERQFSKIANFGYPANMSPTTFIDYCKGYGLDITLAFSEQVKEAWKSKYPEVMEYFNEPNKHFDCNVKNAEGETYKTYTHYTLTGRKRARATYTAFLNTGFQGLAADGMKIALYKLLKEGLETVLVVHDQAVIECPRNKAKEAQKRVEKLMIEGMKEVIKNVNVAVEGQIIERFTK